MGIVPVPAVFNGERVRRVLCGNEWWFAVEDVCSMLMERPVGRECWRLLRKNLEEEGCEIGTLCRVLQLLAPDGSRRRTECVSLEGVFRIVQSVASPKAEVVKRWLAQAGRCEKRERSRGTDFDAVLSLLGEVAGHSIAETVRNKLK